MWYNINNTLSHNALINIVIGPRGYGKTYAAKKLGVKSFLKDGSQFIYLRRYETELDEVKDSLMNDLIVNGEFPHNQIEYKDGTYTVDGKIAGYCIALSRANYYKSASYPLVKYIFFDEFIVDTSTNMRYLKNEVRTFLNFYETIARLRTNVKAILLANSLSFINPYTLFWNISKPKNKNFTKVNNGLVLVELVGDDEYKQAKNNTPFGQLIAGTEMASMAIENEFILDDETFIEKKSNTSRYLFTFTYQDIPFGVWWDYATALYYISENIDPSCPIVYSTTIQDHRPNMMLLKRANKGPFQKLIDAYKLGCVRFESIKIKQVVNRVIEMTL